jgi:hypothetical protein
MSSIRYIGRVAYGLYRRAQYAFVYRYLGYQLSRAADRWHPHPGKTLPSPPPPSRLVRLDPEVSLSCSQERATAPCSEPKESTPRSRIFFNNYFNIIFTCAYVLKVVYSIQAFSIKCKHFTPLSWDLHLPSSPVSFILSGSFNLEKRIDYRTSSSLRYCFLSQVPIQPIIVSRVD